MVTEDSTLSCQHVEDWDHLFPPGVGAHHARGEDVAGEEDQGIVLLLLPDSSQEPGGPPSPLGLPGLHVEAVVVVKERDLLRCSSSDHSHGINSGLGRR